VSQPEDSIVKGEVPGGKPLPSGFSRDLAMVAACFQLLPQYPAHFLQILQPLLISDTERRHRVDGADMDRLLALGWRSHGFTFFRYNLWLHEGICHWILPLRMELGHYRPSKSQRRNLLRNQNLTVRCRAPVLDAEHEELFLKHARRFKDNAPTSLLDYLSPRPAELPCPSVEIEVRLDGKLLAASYMTVGKTAASSVFAIFDPAEADRGLGIFTMLQEIEVARDMQLSHWYPGYATMHQGVYDYKKGFHGLQYFDWRSRWHAFPKGGWDMGGAPLIQDWQNFT
jgi:leucyl-tRNA---protein transferase